MRGRKSLYLIVILGVIFSQVIPISLLLNQAPSRAVAQAVPATPVIDWSLYKNNLKVLGNFVTSAKLSDRTDPSLPITMSIPTDSGSGTPLALSLTNVDISGISTDPNATVDQQNVSDIFYYFTPTDTTQSYSLVLDQRGFGGIFNSSTPDPNDLTQLSYGNPGDCVALQNAADATSAVFSPSTCAVSVAAVSDVSQQQQLWNNFADRVIPADTRASSCTAYVDPQNRLATSLRVGVALASSPTSTPPGYVSAGASFCAKDFSTGAQAALATAKAGNAYGIDVSKTNGGYIWDAATSAYSAAVDGTETYNGFIWASTKAVGSFILNASVATAKAAIKATTTITKVVIGAVITAWDRIFGKCSLRDIITSLQKGLGGAFSTIIGCVVSYMAGSLFEPLQNAMKNIGKLSANPYVGGGLSFQLVGHAQAAYDPVSDSLAHELNPVEAPDGVIIQVWKLSRSIVDVVVILALLLIAFANILHININTYTAKKALPGLVIGVIGANASLLIVRFLADVTQALSQWAVDLSHSGSVYNLVSFAFPAALFQTMVSSTAGIGSVLMVVLAIPLVIYYIFIIVSFALALIKRLVIIYFLAMVAPLAFISYGIPSFQKYFFLWWENILRYMFMFPIILMGASVVVLLYNAMYKTLLTFGRGFTAPGFIAVAIIVIAATYVIKLPKILSKGAIDVGSTLKKVLANVPNAIAAGQVTHAFVKGGGFQSVRGGIRNFKAGLYEKGGIGTFGKKDLKKADELRKSAAKDFREASKLRHGFRGTEQKYLTARGWGTAFGDPAGIMGGWLETRTAADAKENKKQAGKLMGGAMANAFKGAPGAFSDAKERWKDDIDSINSRSDAEAFLKDNKGVDELFKGMVMNWVERGSTPEMRSKRRSMLNNATSYNSLQKLLDNINNGSGYQQDEAGNFILDAHGNRILKDEVIGDGLADDLKVAIKDEQDAQAAAMLLRKGLNIAPRDRLEGVDTDRMTAQQILDLKQSRAIPYSDDISRTPSPKPKKPKGGGGGGGGPRGGGAPRGGGGRPRKPRRFMPYGTFGEDQDDEIDNRLEDTLEQAQAIRVPDVDGGNALSLQKRVDSIVARYADINKEIAEKIGDGGDLSKLDLATSQRLSQIRQETHDALMGSINDDATDIRNAIESATKNGNDKALKGLLDNQSMALAAGAATPGRYDQKSLEYMVAGGVKARKDLDESAEKVSATVDETKLAEAIAEATSGQTDQLAELLKAQTDEISRLYRNGQKVSPKEQTEAMKSIATKIDQMSKSISGKGKLSLRGMLKDALESLPEKLGHFQLDKGYNRPLVETVEQAPSTNDQSSTPSAPYQPSPPPAQPQQPTPPPTSDVPAPDSQTPPPTNPGP